MAKEMIMGGMIGIAASLALLISMTLTATIQTTTVGVAAQVTDSVKGTLTADSYEYNLTQNITDGSLGTVANDSSNLYSIAIPITMLFMVGSIGMVGVGAYRGM